MKFTRKYLEQFVLLFGFITLVLKLSKNSNMQADYDVVILGGGLAGLSLSIQLKRANPALIYFNFRT
jgi:NADH dehydrogenase FAD-containing subunit